MLVALALKQTWRHPLRSALTVLGVATGMFLYTAVETAQHAVRDATAVRAGDEVLIVYRQNRFCPFTSRLPEHYLSRLEQVPGVAEAVPVKVVVNNCGTSFDVVTFRGVPPEEIDGFIGQRLEDMREAEADRVDSLEADIAFHIAILHASGNRFFVQFSYVIETALRFSIRLTNSEKGVRTASVPDHDAIYVAIRNGDAKGAEAASQALLGEAIRLLDERARKAGALAA